jgi:FkbM family methyltransferase
MSVHAFTRKLRRQVSRQLNRRYGGWGVEELAELICPFPGCDLNYVQDRIRATVGDGPVRDLRDIRRCILAVDLQHVPTPFVIRFGEEDIRRRDFDGFHLLLDTSDIVSAALLGGHAYEPHIDAVFRRHCFPGMRVINVGANIGYFAMLAAHLVGQDGHVIAVEPNSENCRLLALAIAENGFENVELWPLALDRSRGWTYFSTHVGSNGGVLPGEPDSLLQGRGDMVPTFCLDELTHEKVSFIKIDVEGAEGRVIDGSRETITKYRPIVLTELSREMLPRVSGTSPEEYLGWFENLGYVMGIIKRDPPGEVDIHSSSEKLLSSWTDPTAIEDLLLLPG